eukprot:3089770-Rhodomonas_salina.1
MGAQVTSVRISRSFPRSSELLPCTLSMRTLSRPAAQDGASRRREGKGSADVGWESRMGAYEDRQPRSRAPPQC